MPWRPNLPGARIPVLRLQRPIHGIARDPHAKLERMPDIAYLFIRPSAICTTKVTVPLLVLVRYLISKEKPSTK